MSTPFVKIYSLHYFAFDKNERLVDTLILTLELFTFVMSDEER